MMRNGLRYDIDLHQMEQPPAVKWSALGHLLTHSAQSE